MQLAGSPENCNQGQTSTHNMKQSDLSTNLREKQFTSVDQGNIQIKTLLSIKKKKFK